MILKGRIILVTGGSKGIGLSIAREFASRGAHLFIIARGQDALEEAQRNLSQEFPDIRVEIASCDVSDIDAVARAVDTMLEVYGEIHGVVNNAGYANPQYFDQIEPEEFRQLMEVDYLGSVYVTKAALPHLSAGAFITFTSSVAGYLGTFGYTSYSPAKFALRGFAESLEQELLSREIQISVLCPPNTETPGFEVEKQIMPFETHDMSKTASLMTSEDVAKRFVNKLVRGKFLINVNIESEIIYRLKGIAPGISRKVMHYMVRSAQRKKTNIDTQ